MIDIFFIGFFIFQAIRGYQKGVILQLVWLVTIVVLFTIWPVVEPLIAPLFRGLQTLTTNEGLLKIIPFAISYLILYLIFQIILSVGSNVKVPILTPLNRLLGSIFALIKASFILFLFLSITAVLLPTTVPYFDATGVWQMLRQLWEPLIPLLTQWLSVWSQNVV